LEISITLDNSGNEVEDQLAPSRITRRKEWSIPDTYIPRTARDAPRSDFLHSGNLLRQAPDQISPAIPLMVIVYGTGMLLRGRHENPVLLQGGILIPGFVARREKEKNPHDIEQATEPHGHPSFQNSSRPMTGYLKFFQITFWRFTS
jgi:hypothetical protein